MTARTATAALGMMAACICVAAGKSPWVTDEERDFVKKRTVRADFQPGTPESDATRFYSNTQGTEFVEFNYDESKAGEGTYTLENPLAFADGRRLKDASEWPARRREILGLFEREVYGRMPPRPDAVVVELVSEKLAEGRFAWERRYRMWFRADKTGPVIDWIAFVPRYAKRPCPVILHLNYKGNDVVAAGRTNHYVLPLGDMAARGYAFISAHYTQITSDAKEKPEADPFNGVCELWGRRDPGRTDNPGALIVWAWGLSRGLDLAERIPEIDAKRSVVTGSSRLGKAALLAAAFDDRFAVCVPNQTGAVGVQLMKRNYGETLAGQRLSLAHWYCKAVWKYKDDPKSQPFDQHLLLACVAPRALLLECYHKKWFDPKGEFLAAKAASPVWEFLTGRGLGLKEMPPPYDDSHVRPPFGYVRRTEEHGLSPYDWKWTMDFADRAFAAAAKAGPAAAEGKATPGKYVADQVLPWGGPQVSSASFAVREVDALDVKCDDAWRALGSRAEYDAYRRELKAKMMSAVGTFPERTPLNARTVATLRRDGYTIEKVVFESMPGVFVTANLFVPDGSGRRPAVVMSCGHADTGKDCDIYLRACVVAVKRGFVALMFDPYYQGERRTSLRKGSCSSHNEMGLRGSLIDWSAPLLRIWDGMRAIDYALTRPEVDPARLGYMGQSGGGTMTALMEAADDRIRAAAPSCYLTSLRALCARMGPQDGEQNIYGQLSFGLNHTGYVLIPDIPIAVTCKFSDMFPYTGVMTLFKTVRALEANVGIGERAFLNCAPGPHGWTETTEQSSVMFLAKQLMPECRDIAIDLGELWQLDLGYDISKVDVGLSKEERGCTEGRTTESLPGWRSIMDVIAERAAKARMARRPLDAAGRAEAARRLAKVKSPSATGFRAKETDRAAVGGLDFARVVVQYTATGHMLPAVCAARPGADGTPVVVAAWGGRRKGFEVARRYIEEGRPVMVADVTGVGEIGREIALFYGATDRPDEGLGAMCYLMGEPLVGRRATDMLVLADVMAARCGGRRPLLVATGHLAVPAAHAWAADASAWSGVEIVDAPASWRDCVEGGSGRMAATRYADIVPTAYLEYDWTDLLPPAP